MASRPRGSGYIRELSGARETGPDPESRRFRAGRRAPDCPEPPPGTTQTPPPPPCAPAKDPPPNTGMDCCTVSERVWGQGGLGRDGSGWGRSRSKRAPDGTWVVGGGKRSPDLGALEKVLRDSAGASGHGSARRSRCDRELSWALMQRSCSWTRGRGAPTSTLPVKPWKLPLWQGLATPLPRPPISPLSVDRQVDPHDLPSSPQAPPSSTQTAILGSCWLVL